MKTEDTNQSPLRLFTVTLDWNDSNPDEGDYCTSVWAKDRDDAILKVANEMADCREQNDAFESNEDREDFIRDTYRCAGPYAVSEADTTAIQQIKELMMGPDQAWSDETKAHFNQVLEILSNYSPSAMKYAIRDPESERPRQ